MKTSLIFTSFLFPSLVLAGNAGAPVAKERPVTIPRFQIYQQKKIGGKIQTFRVKNIPKLRVPGERSLSSTQLAPEPQIPELALNRIKAEKLQLTAKTSVPPEFLKPVLPGKEAALIYPLPDKDKPAVPFAPYTPQLPVAKELAPEKLFEVRPMSPAELKRLEALIFLEIQKSFEMAYSLFAELREEPEFRDEATYEMGRAALAMNLITEYQGLMSELLENKDWQWMAAEDLARNLRSGDWTLAKKLDDVAKDLKKVYDPATSDDFYYLRGQSLGGDGSWKEAIALFRQVPATSALSHRATFQQALALYNQGAHLEALALQGQLLKSLVEKNSQDDLRSIVALTYGRQLFQEKRYKEAFDAYLKVDKKHPEWLQAMTEQAWAQILAEDFEGAAGNMFSLHTDFFKSSFAPESYVVRSIGYLNLCQYGDGARVVAELKKKYGPQLSQLESYQSQSSGPEKYYETLKKWAQNSAEKNVDGLSSEFVFAMTRDENFQKEQRRINALEDEITGWNRVASALLAKDKALAPAQREAAEKWSQFKQQLAKVSPVDRKTLLTKMEYEQKRIMSYQLQFKTVKRALISIKSLRAKGLAQIDVAKNVVKSRAALALKNHFDRMVATLKFALDQSDVLHYEIYSGAGDHLRYQMAGGEVNPKEREELKVKGDKAMTWDFRGEVWEDEIGHFRSSLKNVCPQEQAQNHPGDL